MQGKGAIRFFAIALAIACVYSLSFTFVSSGVEKDAKEFDQFKEKFVEGASKFIAPNAARDLWHDFEAHAGYSFNKSHAVAYSTLSYWTAWLKYYYPLEFMFALLKNEKDKDARTEYLIEAKRLGIKIKLPHVNESDIYFSLKKSIRKIIKIQVYLSLIIIGIVI